MDGAKYFFYQKVFSERKLARIKCSVIWKIIKYNNEMIIYHYKTFNFNFLDRTSVTWKKGAISQYF